MTTPPDPSSPASPAAGAASAAGGPAVSGAPVAAPSGGAAPSRAQLDALLDLRTGPRLAPLTDFARALVHARPRDPELVGATVGALLELVEGCAGTSRQRLDLGEALGLLGDPRLRLPSDPDYWVDVEFEDGHRVAVGRHMVTNAEFSAWVRAGGYDDDAAWSDAGRAWRDSGAPRWDELSADPEVAHLVVPNQPAAGPTWFEAEAYARAMGGRLLTSDERRWLVRGRDKRPYPWGAPFGDGNANTREEALGRPCAVGLFTADRSPEGVTDLAGNMGEWLSDLGGEGRQMLHPGSWARPSMAAWAKALEMADPDTRSADMGFRICRG